VSLPANLLMLRRSLLTGAAALASFAILPRYALGETSSPFTLGVASGDPVADGFVLWTRLAPQPLAEDGGLSGTVVVAWEVALDDAMRHVVQRGEVQTDSRLAHSVHVEVTGLEQNRPYWYRFTALGSQSPVGRTRTMPAPGQGLKRLRFVVASCSHYEMGYFAAYRHMAAENPDLVLFLGDYIYENTLTGQRAATLRVRQHSGPEARDLAGYRNRYAQYHTDPDLQALHAAAPCLMTWDDHEVENDYADQWSEHPDTDPAAFLQRRAAAYQAYYEHMPLRSKSRPNGTSMRVYDQYCYGDLVEFFVLDGRQYRSRQACPTATTAGGHLVTASCTEREDPARSMLGAQQEAWLFEGFRRSQTRWNILAQDLLVASLAETNMTNEVGHWTDGWDGYPACRTRVLDAIAQSRLANPVFLGGDSHVFFTTDLKANFEDPSSTTVATEFVGTSITSEPPPYELFAKFLPANPHIRFFESRYRGYLSVDLSSDQAQVRMQTISDRRDPLATVETLRTWVVENGKTGALLD
jgi:alkaline phosphatase D